MCNKSFTGKIRALLLTALLFGAWNAVSAEDNTYLLAQNAQHPPENTTPPSGTLVLPADTAGEETTEKKCMTVCASWGEECTYINRGAGGTTRSCRRTCQQYTEECF